MVIKSREINGKRIYRIKRGICVFFFFYHNIGEAGSQGGDRGAADL